MSILKLRPSPAPRKWNKMSNTEAGIPIFIYTVCFLPEWLRFFIQQMKIKMIHMVWTRTDNWTLFVGIFCMYVKRWWKVLYVYILCNWKCIYIKCVSTRWNNSCAVKRWATVSRPCLLHRFSRSELTLGGKRYARTTVCRFYCTALEWYGRGYISASQLVSRGSTHVRVF